MQVRGYICASSDAFSRAAVGFLRSVLSFRLVAAALFLRPAPLRSAPRRAVDGLLLVASYTGCSLGRARRDSKGGIPRESSDLSARWRNREIGYLTFQGHFQGDTIVSRWHFDPHRLHRLMPRLFSRTVAEVRRARISGSSVRDATVTCARRKRGYATKARR